MFTQPCHNVNRSRNTAQPFFKTDCSGFTISPLSFPLFNPQRSAKEGITIARPSAIFPHACARELVLGALFPPRQDFANGAFFVFLNGDGSLRQIDAITNFCVVGTADYQTKKTFRTVDRVSSLAPQKLASLRYRPESTASPSTAQGARQPAPSLHDLPFLLQ